MNRSHLWLLDGPKSWLENYIYRKIKKRLDRPVGLNSTVNMQDVIDIAKSKRDEIIEVASKLFYEQGYNRTGIQQIIKEAGVAKGTFYSHFSSKEELGVTWLKTRHIDWNKSLNNFLHDTPEAKNRILMTFDFLTQGMQDSGHRGCAFLNTLAETPETDSPLRDVIAFSKHELLDHFISLVEQHWSDESEEQQRQLGITIYMLFEAAILELQNFRELWPINAAKTQVASFL